MAPGEPSQVHDSISARIRYSCSMARDLWSINSKLALYSDALKLLPRMRTRCTGSVTCLCFFAPFSLHSWTFPSVPTLSYPAQPHPCVPTCSCMLPCPCFKWDSLSGHIRGSPAAHTGYLIHSSARWEQREWRFPIVSHLHLPHRAKQLELFKLN